MTSSFELNDERERFRNDYMDINIVSNTLLITVKSIKEKIDSIKLQDKVIVNNDKWYIPKSILPKIEEEFNPISEIPDGYFTDEQAAVILGLSCRNQIGDWIKDGKLTGAYKHKIRPKNMGWIVPKIQIENISPIYQGNYLTVKEVAKNLNISLNGVNSRVARGKYPNTVVFNSKRYIPIEDIEYYENDKKKVIPEFKVLTGEDLNKIDVLKNEYIEM